MSWSRYLASQKPGCSRYEGNGPSLGENPRESDLTTGRAENGMNGERGSERCQYGQRELNVGDYTVGERWSK